MSIKESALTAITSISNSDFVRAVTSAGASRRITVSDLAKQIIEGYAGSTVAGSAQSVKSALDSLNSKYSYAAGATTQEITLRASSAGFIVLTWGTSANLYFFNATSTTAYIKALITQITNVNVSVAGLDATFEHGSNPLTRFLYYLN